jgi:hypothetical protein
MHKNHVGVGLPESRDIAKRDISQGHVMLTYLSSRELIRAGDTMPFKAFNAGCDCDSIPNST